MSKKVVIIGGEGNGGVVASCIEDNRNRYGDTEWEVVGFINDFETEVSGYPVIGKLEDLPRLLAETDYYFSWAIHLVGRSVKTMEMFNEANIPDERLATVIHKSAFIGSQTEIGPGCMVMSGSYVGPMTKLGKCTFIMANCSIGHNVTTGPLCHCSVGTIMTGYSSMGICADMSIGSACLAYVKVGDYAMVGAKALATKDVPEREIHVGTPAKFLKMIRED